MWLNAVRPLFCTFAALIVPNIQVLWGQMLWGKLSWGKLSCSQLGSTTIYPATIDPRTFDLRTLGPIHLAPRHLALGQSASEIFEGRICSCWYRFLVLQDMAAAIKFNSRTIKGQTCVNRGMRTSNFLTNITFELKELQRPNWYNSTRLGKKNPNMP